MIIRRAIGYLLIPLCCLLLAACGGGGGGSSSTTADQASSNWDSLVWDQDTWN